MMGMQVAPAQLFYDSCLVDHVLVDHFYGGSTASSIWTVPDLS
jgi:hypothetical protein